MFIDGVEISIRTKNVDADLQDLDELTSLYLRQLKIMAIDLFCNNPDFAQLYEETDLELQSFYD